MTNTLALLMKKKIKSLKLKNKAKKLIEEENVIYDVKARNIFDNSVKKVIKRKSAEDPKEEIKEQIIIVYQ